MKAIAEQNRTDYTRFHNAENMTESFANWTT
jgi:hypothetical protein